MARVRAGFPGKMPRRQEALSLRGTLLSARYRAGSPAVRPQRRSADDLERRARLRARIAEARDDGLLDACRIKALE